MTIAVVTPSYRNDWPIFLDLHESVLRYTDDSVTHHVIVPDSDTWLFSQAAGPRCIIIPESTLYPAHFRPLPLVNQVLSILPRIPAHARIAAVNLRRPFHPIRGWIMQQALKMEACRRIDDEILLIIDSDVVLMRAVTASTLSRGGFPHFYRRHGAVDVHLPQHVRWHAVSRDLLGLPAGQLPAPDYVSSFTVWDPRVVRALVARVERVTGRHWMDAIVAQPTFSEWTLYGVFVEELMTEAANSATESSLCHSYWDPAPLTTQRAAEFMARMPSDDVAVLIQSKSHTPLAVRRAALASLDASRRLERGHRP